MDVDIEIKETKEINKEKIIKLYKANKWSSAKKPDLLYKALMNSDSLITAWDGNRLVGLGNAISDGYLVVYYPHLLVHPDYQGKGIGRMIFNKFQKKYGNFHQQMERQLIFIGNVVSKKQAQLNPCGFIREMNMINKKGDWI